MTDNLNFGNPERPEIMGQFVGCIRGIGEACRALDFPVVSGNVSLYNETNGRAHPADADHRRRRPARRFHASPRRIAFKAADEAILLVGETHGWLGQSLYLREICGREEGAPPPVDLAAERRNGEFVRALIRDGIVTAVHDVSDGGLLVALAEMAMASGIGAELDRRRRRRRRTPSGSARTRRATSSRVPGRGATRVHRCAAARGRRAGPRSSASPAAIALTLPGERPILVAKLTRALRGLAAGLYGSGTGWLQADRRVAPWPWMRTISSG